ncbi:helix-turn-helix domain-containing protein [Halomonas almeriensis]|uniref:helix-turn-helix transcriptional regulator n=1 Tax=Halomonas almeriensis TaxID=308163 RepID=UPI0025B3981B|nr:helix-turn-helix domain-containing protein [Halomonas almeriensis]MDN3553268.1 helix-turn-helix domain-containing protein [Halomonas almeriensis]
MSDTPRTILTEKEAAELLRIKPATLRQSRWNGKLAGLPAPKYLTIGRNIRYRQADLDAWLDSAAEEVCP